jgi:hypothetical protein
MHYEVLSIHPTTHSPAYIPARTLEEAMRLRNMAESDGYMLAEVICSWGEREDWRRRAKLQFRDEA